MPKTMIACPEGNDGPAEGTSRRTASGDRGAGPLAADERLEDLLLDEELGRDQQDEAEGQPPLA